MLEFVVSSLPFGALVDTRNTSGCLQVVPTELYFNFMTCLHSLSITKKRRTLCKEKTQYFGTAFDIFFYRSINGCLQRQLFFHRLPQFLPGGLIALQHEF